MKVEFIKATMDDFAEIQRKMNHSFEEISKRYVGHKRFIPPGFDDGSFLKKNIPMGKIVNIVVDDVIAGGYYVLPYEENTEDMELKVLWIDTDYQNRGIGSIAWKHIENSYQTNVWWLETPKFAKSNHHFYEKLGFQMIKETEMKTVTLILYRKEL